MPCEEPEKMPEGAAQRRAQYNLPAHFYDSRHRRSDLAMRACGATYTVFPMRSTPRPTGSGNRTADPPVDKAYTREFVELLMKLPAAERSKIMCREKMRRHSFGSLWPIATMVAPEALAKAGFYYTGIADRVQCAVCRGVLRNWEEGDVAWEEHRKHFGFCRLITGQDANNTPISMDTEPLLTTENLRQMIEASNPSSSNRNSMGQRQYSSVPPTFANSFGSLHGSSGHSSLSPDSGRHGSSEMGGPRSLDSSMGRQQGRQRFNPFAAKGKKYSDFISRMNTFSSGSAGASSAGWTGAPKSFDMAKAGFYMTGNGDEVKCFDCDICLSHWKATDIPKKEHQKESPHCPFVLKDFGEPRKPELTGSNSSLSSISDEESEPTRWEYHPTFQRILRDVNNLDIPALNAILGRRYPNFKRTMPTYEEIKTAVETERRPAAKVSPSARSHLSSNSSTSGDSGLESMSSGEMLSSNEGFNSSSTSGSKSAIREKSAVPLSEMKSFEVAGRSVPVFVCGGCEERPANTVSLPCGHMVFCDQCSTVKSTCPSCTQSVKAFANLDLLVAPPSSAESGALGCV